nr:8352_t:CDS:10 [Entrophospora candida]
MKNPRGLEELIKDPRIKKQMEELRKRQNKEIEQDEDDVFFQCEDCCENCKKIIKQRLVIENIKGGFEIDFDRQGISIFDEYSIPKNVGYNQIENFDKIFTEVKNYFRNNQGEFYLGQLIIDNPIEAQKKGEQQRDRRVSDSPCDYQPTPTSSSKRVMCGRTRKIERQNHFIHPAALTEGQYEELKNLLPNETTCKVKGCSNNFKFGPGFEAPVGLEDMGQKIAPRGGICNFHNTYPDYHDANLGVGKDIGNKITIRDVSFGPDKARIEHYREEIIIDNYFRTIEKVTTIPFQVPPTNPNPTTYAEVQQKNLEIQVQNSDLALLAAELLDIIDKNNKLCDQAKSEKGLNLIAMSEPDGSPMQLNDFNTCLEELDENQPLNSTANQKQLVKNQKNVQRKKDFAKRLKDIYKKNQVAYQKASTQNQGTDPSLENIRIAAIFQIESKQVDMKVLENGKYQNYQSVIESLDKEEEIENYKNEILLAIFRANEEKKNDNQNSKKHQPLINQGEKEIIEASSLEEARNKASEEIRNFFAKMRKEENKMDFEILLNDGTKVKARDFQEHFKRLNSKREILEFCKLLKREMVKHITTGNHQNNGNKSPENNLLIPILIGSFIVILAVLVGFADLVKRLEYRGITQDKLLLIKEKLIKKRELNEMIGPLREERNKLIKEGKETAQEVEKINEKVALLEKELGELKKKLSELTNQLPNLPAFNTPTTEEGNKIIDSTEYRHHIQHNLTHEKILEKLNLIDKEKSILLSGSKFTVYQGLGSELLHALINFMRTENSKRGYRLFDTPYLVNSYNLYNTGQFHKFQDNLYKIEKENEKNNLYLIPTAEVSLVNLYQDQILTEKDLPLNLCAYSPCFRAERMAAGQENKGLVRLHQFHKVELVKMVKPENSYSELEKLVSDARNILHQLKIPHRVIELCHKDNCEDFQSRRAKIRVRVKEGQKYFPHTLNGSALAVDRLIIALCEYYYNEQENKLVIPETLSINLRIKSKNYKKLWQIESCINEPPFDAYRVGDEIEVDLDGTKRIIRESIIGDNNIMRRISSPSSYFSSSTNIIIDSNAQINGNCQKERYKELVKERTSIPGTIEKHLPTAKEEASWLRDELEFSSGKYGFNPIFLIHPYCNSYYSFETFVTEPYVVKNYSTRSLKPLDIVKTYTEKKMGPGFYHVGVYLGKIDGEFKDKQLLSEILEIDKRLKQHQEKICESPLFSESRKKLYEDYDRMVEELDQKVIKSDFSNWVMGKDGGIYEQLISEINRLKTEIEELKKNQSLTNSERQERMQENNKKLEELTSYYNAGSHKTLKYNLYMNLEKTLSIIKPDVGKMNLIGEIINVLEKKGSPVVVMCLEGENAIKLNREIMGATNPQEAKIGTIRRTYGESIDANAVHGSDSPEAAEREINLFFKKEEIFPQG